MKRFTILAIAVGTAAVVISAGLRCLSAEPGARPKATPREAELFGVGVFSTPDEDDSIAFTPDGKTAYFVKRCPGTVGTPLPVICESHLSNGRWSTPSVAPFSGRYRDGSPSVSSDGKRLFFASARPVDGSLRKDYDIWAVERSGDSWGDPRNLGEPVNSTAQEFTPSTSADGTLYFSSSRPGGRGPLSIYRSRLVDGRYQTPELLDENVNSENGEFAPCISQDERFLIFVSAGRADEIVGVHARYNAGDLYISYRADRGWTPARNLGRPVNSGARESSPRLSPDGRYLYFTSERGFATERAPRARTYEEIVRANHSVENSLGNIWRVPLDWVLDGVREPTPSR